MTESPAQGVIAVRTDAGDSYTVRLTVAAAVCVAVLAAAGVIQTADLVSGFHTLWRPSLAILSIMLSTLAAQRLGVLDVVAERMAPKPDQSPAHVFRSVFVFSAMTSAILNNDAAVLLLTPLIVGLVRRCYPNRPDLVGPFAFAVFSAAGVAPLATSNPMNLIIADYTGIGFNAYALRMAPIALAGWIVAYAILRFLFRERLGRMATVGVLPRGRDRELTMPARVFLIVLVLSLACYPTLSFLGGPVWVVAAGIAAFGAGLCWSNRTATPGQLMASLSWPIMVFLYCIFGPVLGLRHLGLADALGGFYAWPASSAGGTVMIAAFSALGSAFLNNHPMALLNALALQSQGVATHQHVLAALIGGDLGPRLLPMGSLAGLLWMDSLRRLRVPVTLSQFVGAGAAVTLPALAVSVAILLLGQV